MSAKMEVKMLQKSNTFTSLSAVSKRSTSIGSWFDRRARKLSMKCSRSITLGKGARNHSSELYCLCSIQFLMPFDT